MQLNIQQIKDILPHRYPFLMIDKITEMDLKIGKAIAQKNVTNNEEFFQGHFPNQPIMPGVLILESMAQAIAVLGITMMSNLKEKDKNKLFILAGVDNFRIKKPVVPGDVLKLHVEIGKIKHSVCKSHAKAYVNDDLIALADFTAAYKEI
jgi:3-hydroxyacyl-[acyl-carrier-protein] dehydratase